MTPARRAKAPAPAAPPALSEPMLQELVSDYYLAQVARTRIDYIDAHREGLITTPFEYSDGGRIEVEVSEGASAGVLRLCDLGAVNEYLGHCYQQCPRDRVDALRCTIQALCEPAGIVLDSVEGLVSYTRPGQYIDSLHRFITTLVRVDALFRGFFINEERGSARKSAKGGVK